MQIIKFTLIWVPIKSVAQRCTRIYDFDHYSIWITRIWKTRISSGPENRIIQVAPVERHEALFLAHKAMLILVNLRYKCIVLKNPIWTAIMQYGATLVTTYWWYYHMHPNVYTFGMQNILVLKTRVLDQAFKTNK